MPILASATGYGLRPTSMVGGGAYTGSFQTFRLGSVATTTSLSRGNLVRVTAGGAFSSSAGTGLTANTGGIVGVLEGVEYVNDKGEYTIGTHLPTAATSTLEGYTEAKLRIITDPNVVYSVLADHTLLAASVNVSGAQLSIGAHCSLDEIDSSGTGIFRTGQGKATTLSALGTVALTIVGMPDEIVDEAMNAVTRADSNWVGDVLVRINPTVHTASAGVGIN